MDGNKVINSDLQPLYDAIYSNGYSQFTSCSSIAEIMTILNMLPTWEDLTVLEIGCGEGKLAAMMAMMGSRHVAAIDYSRQASKQAKAHYSLPNRFFEVKTLNNERGIYDVIIMQGVLEHLDQPFNDLKKFMDNNIMNDGCIITSSPNFINPRGYICMTIQMFFDIKMSMADLHCLSPSDFVVFCNKHDYTLEMKSCDQDWGGGRKTIQDFDKRFKSDIFKEKYVNATGITLPDEKIDKFLAWLQVALQWHEENRYSGANIIYKIGCKR